MKRCPQCGKQYASEANFCPVDAGRLEDVPDDAPAEADDHLLGGRFVVGDPIGGGLTGQVFKAIDKESGFPCVVKWVDSAVFSSPLQMQRTERELKQLERQQAAGIARVLFHGRREDKLWVASEYVAGVALDGLVANVGPLPLERATKIVHDVGVALAEAAKLGVIHRDVAPKNVLVGDGDEVHVINFGIAVPGTGAVRGTPEFVAPEQVDGKPVDQRSNIYSLGAMLYALVVGKPPFEGDAEAVHNAHLHSPPPHASSEAGLDESTGDALDRLLDRALAKQSSKRFMTLRQLLSELEKLAGIEPSSTQRMAGVSASPPIASSASSASSSVTSTQRMGEVASASGASGANGNTSAAGKASSGKSSRGDSRRHKGQAAETLLGVAAFASPSGEQSAVDGGGVVSEAASETSSGVAALAPPVTQPPPLASHEPMSMPALAPVESQPHAQPEALAEQHEDGGEANGGAMGGQQDDDVDAAETNALPVSTEHEAPPAQDVGAESALAQAQAQAAARADEARDVEARAATEVAPEPTGEQPERAASSDEGAAGQSFGAGQSTASGKRRKRKKKKKSTNNKFRETMWFKKGELDQAAAEAAAGASGSLVSSKADELPADERYNDDGTLSAEDEERLSLKTGHTQMMSAMQDRAHGASASHEAISDEELAREMTGGNKRLLIAGAVLLLVVVIVVVIILAK